MIWIVWATTVVVCTALFTSIFIAFHEVQHSFERVLAAIAAIEAALSDEPEVVSGPVAKPKRPEAIPVLSWEAMERENNERLEAAAMKGRKQ